MRIKKTSQTTPATAQVVNTHSTSQTDTYSCDYANNLLGGVLTKSFNNTTSVDITSAGGWGLVVIFSSIYGAVLQLQGGNTPNITTIYGTLDFTTSVNNNVVTLNDLHNWDHYILLGSNAITNIE